MSGRDKEHKRAYNREYNKKYYAQNAETLKKKSADWYIANRARAIKRIGEYQKKNAAAIRVYKRQWSYGLSEEQFSLLLETQRHCCVGCGREQWEFGEFHVDHDHATGNVRGLLCSPCNTVLGMAKDSVDTLLNLIEYLRRAGG